MLRTAIDLDDELLAEAARLRKREAFFAWLDEGGLPALTDGPAESPGDADEADEADEADDADDAA